MAKPSSFATFSHDGRLIVTASQDHTAQIWDVKTGTKVRGPLLHENWVKYAAFSPDDRKLITGSFDRKARVWDVETSRRILPDLNHGDGVQSAEFSPDGRLIITASLDGTVRLWRADNLQPILYNPVLKHNAPVNHASLQPRRRINHNDLCRRKGTGLGSCRYYCAPGLHSVLVRR